MVVLACYDVNTQTSAGRRRLRQIADACQDFGTRVQFSIFECHVSPAQWVELRNRLLKTMEPKEDSIRFYFLDERAMKRTEHHGVRVPIDVHGPLIF